MTDRIIHAPAEIFSGEPTPTIADAPLRAWSGLADPSATLDPLLGDAFRLVYEGASDPSDPISLRDAYLAYALTGTPPAARRSAEDAEILGSRAVVRCVKELFNYYFRDDLYGRRRAEQHVIMSSGSVNEELFGLANPLKDCIRYALDRDWYGYSDSRGRAATREAIAALENERVAGAPYDERWISVTIGGTVTVYGLADFLLAGATPTAPVLCGIPNYPPLVEALARRSAVQLVPTPCGPNGTDIAALIEAVRPDTPAIFLQTVTNPTGTAVSEAQLAQLVQRVGPHTTVILDEAHECLGPVPEFGVARAHRQVVRVTSMSKDMSTPGLKLGWLVAHPDFIADWYEYASTSMGGPPSVFYLLVEAISRFEAWRLAGVEDAGDRIAEWSEYPVSVPALRAAYTDYRRQRDRRAQVLTSYRDWAVGGLTELGYAVVPPRYSINIAASPPGAQTSYGWWARTLDDLGVSIYPGILSFCFDDRWIRLTASTSARSLCMALSRLPYYPPASPPC
jgi:aspartate/methionine/tyrosine aminotransferase